MTRALRVGLLIGLAMPAGSLVAGPPERGPMPHLVDLYGDALPEGAVARLGSVRLRHLGLADFGLVADGKTAVTVGGDQMIRWWDLDSGRQVGAVPLPREVGSGQLAVSLGGDAVAIGGTGKLFVCSSRTGRIEQVIDCEAGDYQGLTFSPDASLIAYGTANAVLTVVSRKTEQGQQVRLGPDRKGCGFGGMTLSFSADGRRIIAGNLLAPDRAVSVLDASSLKEIFKTPTWAESVALSPDGTRVAVCTLGDPARHGGAVLRLFDVGTGKETLRKAAGLSDSGFSVAFARDGKAVLAGGPTQASLIDPETGRLLRSMPVGPEGRLSADGRWVASVGWHRLRVWDAAAGRESFHQPGDFDVGARAASADGRVLAVEAVGESRIGLWDTSDGRLIRELRMPDGTNYHPRFAFAPDGRWLLATRSMGSAWTWDIWTGQSTRPTSVWMRDEPGGPYHEYVPSPDGRRVAAMVVVAERDDTPRRLVVWEASTGQLIHRHALGLKGAVNIKRWLPGGNTVAIGVAVAGKSLVRFVDPETGHVGAEFEADESLSIASDGRLAASWRDGPQRGERNALVWDIATGQEILRVPTGESVHRGVGVAAAARALLVADGRSLRIIDLVTAKERSRWALPEVGSGYFGDHPVWEVRVLPGDRAVMTPIQDGTALIWDLTAFPPPPLSDKHGEPELLAWWDELAGADAARAYAAGWKLSEAPADGVVAFLRPRLRAATSIDADEVRKRIADLDSPTFVTREAASRRLQQMGPAVLPYLRKRPAAPSAEAVERLQTLEERLSDPVPPAETLRALRAVAVLERVATTDARKLLEELARGASDAAETRAARAALDRMRPTWPAR
jgi:WD40 repeat protein